VIKNDKKNARRLSALTEAGGHRYPVGIINNEMLCVRTYYAPSNNCARFFKSGKKLFLGEESPEKICI